MNKRNTESESRNLMQLASLMKENKLLRGTLRNQAKIAPLILQDEKSYDDRESLSSGLDSGNVEYAENSPDKATETTLENFEASSLFLQLKSKLILINLYSLRP